MKPDAARGAPPRLAAIAGALATLLACSTACRSSSGGAPDAAPVEASGPGLDATMSESGADASSSPPDGGLDIDGGDAGVLGVCRACLVAECTGEATLCAQIADCVSLVGCAADAGAIEGCVCAHSRGAAVYAELSSCERAAECSPDCRASCLGVAAPTVCAAMDAGAAFPSCDGGLAPSEAGVQACGACVGLTCEEEVGRCVPGSDCIAYEACVLGCRPTDPGCPPACRASHAEGYGLAQSLFDCETQNCGGACGS